MRPRNHRQSIRVVEILTNVLSKSIPRSSRWYTPSCLILRDDKRWHIMKKKVQSGPWKHSFWFFSWFVITCRQSKIIPDLSSGSDHNKSHIGPSCGTSWNLSNLMTQKFTIFEETITDFGTNLANFCSILPFLASRSTQEKFQYENFLQLSDMIKRINRRAQSSMLTKNFAFNKCCQR